MSKIIATISFLLSLLLVLSYTASCNPDDEVEDPPIDSIRLDSSEVSFTADVQKVLQNGNCLGCHSNQVKRGDVSVEGHKNLAKAVEEHNLLKAIRHESGAVPMPLDRPKLTEARIWVIERWVLQGLKDN